MPVYPLPESLFTEFIEQVEEYAIFGVDPEGIITTWNAGAERIKGFKEEEILGQHLRVLFPEEYQKQGKPEREIEQARQNGVYKVEDWRRRKDGSLFWARVVLTAVNGEDGKLVGFTKITGDRTQHKKHEEELKQHTKLLNSLPEMIWTANPEGSITWVNEWFYQFTGQQFNSQVGWNWINVIHPDDVATSLPAWSHSISTGEVYQIEQRIRRTDGEYIPHLVRAFPLKDGKGTITKWVGSSVDIQMQKQLENSRSVNELLEEKVRERAREIVAKNEELQRINQTLDTLVHIAAHDLRSPVNNLTALLALLDKNMEEGKRQQLHNLIKDSVQRLSGTINGLIEIIQSQHQDKLRGITIHLDRLVERIEQEYKDLEADGGHLRTDFSGLSKLCYNEAYLESILRNLVSNAVKYRSPGRPLELVISSQQIGEWALLTVRDNGIGMDLSLVKEKLFQPFKRFTQQAEGTGVGLHIVKSMVEHNGGYITVESQPDQGTTFRLFLKEYE